MNSQLPTIAVVGGGNGGFAFAGWLGLKGFPIVLAEFGAFDHCVEALRAKGAIRVTGTVEGEARIEVAASIADAVQKADIVLAVIPAHVHGRFAREAAGVLRDDAILVLNPGRTGGALEVYRLLAEADKHLAVVESQTLLFACRKNAPDAVHLNGIKEKVAVGVMPACETQAVVGRLAQVVPQFYAAQDIRVTSFGNIGAMFHPSISVLNASRIEAGTPFEFYKNGATPRVGALIEALDRERVCIAQAAGVRVPTIREWLQQSYRQQTAPLHVMMGTNPAYQGIQAPQGLDIRYLHEDVPTGLVPLEALGRLFGVQTPLISSMVNLAESLMQTDYRRTGRTLAVMGIEGFGPQDLIRYIRTGRCGA